MAQSTNTYDPSFETATESRTLSADDRLSKTLEKAVVNAVLRETGPSRRQLLAGLGSAALVGLISEFLPLSRIQALAADPSGNRKNGTSASGSFPLPALRRLSWPNPWASIANMA